MTLTLIICSAIWIAFIIIMFVCFYFEPKFEMKLTQDEIYNNYTLYLLYLKCEEEDCEYKEKKLFTIKKRRNNNDKRRTKSISEMLNLQ